MSHLDELDEFEADAELRLKKEYTAVFGLFRYCVLTQDATYLCNKLDLQYVPQASYPFFHLRMEDVWVWDKNRPTRMIPRAEVYTSGDVSVEELRGDDDPALYGGGTRRAHARDALLGRHATKMLLAVDVGNTQTVYGVFDGDRLAEHYRVATERRRTADELYVLISGLLDLDGVDGVCLSSTVPPLVREYEAFAERGRTARARTRPRRQHGHCAPLRRPPRDRAGPDRERGRGEGALRRAGDRRGLRHVDELRRRLARRGVRRRSPRARDRDLDGRALRPRVPPVPRRLHAAADRDREDDADRAPVGARLRLRRAGRRDRHAHTRRARRRGAGGRHRRAGRARRAALADPRARRSVPDARGPRLVYARNS